MRRTAVTRLAVLAALAAPAPLAAQQPVARPFDLSVDNLMRGPDLYGTAPSQVRFSDDSRFVYFHWRRPGVDTAAIAYRVSVDGGAPEPLSSIAEDTLYPEPGVWSADRKVKAYVHGGDVWIWDAAAGVKRRITDTPASESGAQLSGDGRTVYFVRDDNLFAFPLDGGALRQLTDIRHESPPRASADTTAQRRFLQTRQRELFDFIRNPPPGAPFTHLPSDSLTGAPRPFYLGPGQSLQGWFVSPDGKYLLITLVSRPAGARVQILPYWVTATGYVEEEPNRAKVGDEQPMSKAGVMDLLTGAVQWLDPGLGSRRADVTALGWSSNSRHALLRGWAKDYHDRWLWVADASDFKVRVLDALHDDAWVGSLSRSAGWLPDGETVWFTSEATGWAHLYTVSAAGGRPRALTHGDWEVEGVALTPDGRRFFLQTTEATWAQRQLYVMDLDGGGKTQLTDSVGRSDGVMSPDGRWLAILYSTSNHPPELYLQPNQARAAWRRTTESTTEEFRSYPWRVPELVQIPASDGARVPARLLRPAGRANGAAVIFAHGAGYLQDVDLWWSEYAREYLFDHLLAERGYVVLDVDYRGSAGHGRDWRTAIYKHMGGRDLDDQVDAARWLTRTQGVDSARIGIWGGSYGGFLTLMAMFTRPGIFRAGAALRPVTDWAHYNHPYTAPILGLPQDDSAAYRRSSPISFAEGLQGALLICHGLVDNNVNFEDTARLIERLIELRKEHWWVAVYPVESHGFRTAASWADEYKRILDLFEKNLVSR